MQRVGGGGPAGHLPNRILALLRELDGAAAIGRRRAQPAQRHLQFAEVADEYSGVLPFLSPRIDFQLFAASQEILDGLGIRHDPGGGPDEVDDDIAGEVELVEFLDEVGVVILELLLEDGLHGDAVEARGQLGAIARELGRDRREEDPVGVERGRGRFIPEAVAPA